MNYVYMISVGKFQEHLPMMLKSLFRYCKCTVFLHVCDVELAKSLVEQFEEKVKIFEMTEQEWVGRRMFCKIQRLRFHQWASEDCIFVLDTDLIIQGDIFKVFEQNFDVCYTSRHYNYWAPVNGGVWGFKYNESSFRFLSFFVNQIDKPEWTPFVDYQKRVKHKPENLDWWCDQDFLCAVHEAKGNLPFDCKIIDLGSKYNFCPGADVIGQEQAEKEIIGKIGNSKYKILHFKAKLKKRMKTL